MLHSWSHNYFLPLTDTPFSPCQQLSDEILCKPLCLDWDVCLWQKGADNPPVERWCILSWMSPLPLLRTYTCACTHTHTPCWLLQRWDEVNNWQCSITLRKLVIKGTGWNHSPLRGHMDQRVGKGFSCTWKRNNSIASPRNKLEQHLIW